MYIKDFLNVNKKFAFRDMLEESSSKVTVIVTFLVILELIKTGFVTVSQEDREHDIYIEVVKDPSLIENIEED